MSFAFPLRRRKSATNSETQKKKEWTPKGATKEELLSQMLTMYWDAVFLEIEHAILTLQDWQQDWSSSVELAEEKNKTFIHGFDTFIDQVSDTSRYFAEGYGISRLFHLPE